ncbi:preprotein translocase subunit YajC [Ethanoligenens harbinense]|uniref:Preprotein translocase, YajC subunit n=1 Tax=Ethanoligenens harbinense (strain DSM 18485 / JCM 12961 / CGMCC 1.5033 / YUAN-3) TaxID=663278 RepID=E6U6Z1_ETHHY|nr:preprotein translocase subunit YajC [Ethanoligenens harbinense]ADU26958.1 preprotein translocase, YajC subunit [Ethanoligenens harbinense YUAN-3]AVQ97411.1 preprotein translocase subunit YajC [Ethanoligenens harbinense YUAN-3]AYF40067.1 preprotein translocase subunit YajC [Ethanoligenens harbinense]AYF42900.1 preprotein translocase subunit YajC [Ethanoligenens harbinense]QCN93663.1 preprotein translocase subunit YajC [Ethanoligenens harbinense]
MQLLAATSSTGDAFSSISIFVVIILMFVVMYFFMIRPQRKKEKEAKAMRENLVVGDEITTIGGIVGRVVSIKDDTIVIETGADREKIRIRKWAIQSVETMHDDKE